MSGVTQHDSDHDSVTSATEAEPFLHETGLTRYTEIEQFIRPKQI